jgi:adenylate kinase
MTSGRRYLVLGKQGAGKGTQAAGIASHCGIAHISTGDMFRRAATGGTRFGRQAADYMERGELVPDAVVIGMVAERLADDDTVSKGFVLDGFPRTRVQAEELQRLLRGADLDAAVSIEVPTEVVLRRLSSRRREDDTDEVIRRRLEVYQQESGPLLDYYDELGLLIRVDGVGRVDEVFERILGSLENGRRPASRSR